MALNARACAAYECGRKRSALRDGGFKFAFKCLRKRPRDADSNTHAHKSGQVAVAHISTSARPNFSCVARLGVCPSVPEEERRGGWQLRDVLAGFASAPSPAWLAEAAV